MKTRSRRPSTSSSEQNFLNAAARAVGSTLGKLATKTGLAGQTPTATRKKRAVATKAAAKRKTAAKKTTVKRGQR